MGYHCDEGRFGMRLAIAQLAAPEQYKGDCRLQRLSSPLGSCRTSVRWFGVQWVTSSLRRWRRRELRWSASVTSMQRKTERGLLRDPEPYMDVSRSQLVSLSCGVLGD